MLGHIHHLHDVRNALAHGKKVKFEAGITFDYIDLSGNFPTDKQKRRKDKRQKQQGKNTGAKEQGDILLWDEISTITYSELHQYENEMAEIAQTLSSIEITPLSLGRPTAGLARNIAEIVASSDNIIPFRKKPSPKGP